MQYTVRPAIVSDLNKIVQILDQSRAFFKQNKIDQWQDGYPFPETILQDIQNGNSYLLLGDEQVIGTAALCQGIEEAYANIYNGQWHSAGPYACIHRVAVANTVKGTGAAGALLQTVLQMGFATGVDSIRIDTHRDNLPMQKFLQKNGFTYCGIVYLASGAERFSYDLLKEAFPLAYL